MDPQEHEKWNEEMAIRYDPNKFITQTGFVIRWMENNRLLHTLKALQSGSSSTVLDLGCGPGNLLEKLSGKRVIGVDLSESLLEQAKRRVMRKSNVTLQKADAQNLPFEESSFDRIVCSEVLEHVRDPSGVLGEIHRISRPDGRVVLTVPNEALINVSKRWVLALGLKKIMSGNYPMSENMLQEWHRSEISPQWIQDHCADQFQLARSFATPAFFFPYHHIYILKTLK